MDIENRIISTIEKGKNNVVKIITTKTKGLFHKKISNEICGSGFFVKKNYILTNYHVIEKLNIIQVELIDGSIYLAKIVFEDKYYDICVLKINYEKNSLLKLSSKNLKEGNIVISIGMPFGLDFCSTIGIISSLNHSLKNEYGNIISEVIQVDNIINPGNSGGPLLNTMGDIIGMNTLSIYDSNKISFALKIDFIKEIIEGKIKE